MFGRGKKVSFVTPLELPKVKYITYTLRIKYLWVNPPKKKIRGLNEWP